MTTNAFQMTVNGKDEPFESNTTLKQLLDSKGINPNVIACELNMKIIRRAQLSETILKAGDQLEIIQMVGGG